MGTLRVGRFMLTPLNKVKSYCMVCANKKIVKSDQPHHRKTTVVVDIPQKSDGCLCFAISDSITACCMISSFANPLIGKHVLKQRISQTVHNLPRCMNRQKSDRLVNLFRRTLIDV